MNVLVDTNILTRAAQPGHPLHQIAIGSGDALTARGDLLCIFPQVLYEFWAVATRPPGENGLGLSSAETQSELARIKRLFMVLPETPGVLPMWEELVSAYDVKGRNTYDARLVAAMKVHSVTHVLTFNGPDFARYAGITVLAPQLIRPSA